MCVCVRYLSTLLRPASTVFLSLFRGTGLCHHSFNRENTGFGPDSLSKLQESKLFPIMNTRKHDNIAKSTTTIKIAQEWEAEVVITG